MGKHTDVDSADEWQQELTRRLENPWRDIPYDGKESEWFFAGGWEQWADKYPQLFDPQDRGKKERSQNRRSYFNEWLSAITLFKEDGWLSLVGKYSNQVHPRKISIVKDVVKVSDKVWKLLEEETGIPDLFVYRSDLAVYRDADWFLAEVKGPTNNYYEDSQINMFKRLEQMMGKEVRIIRVRKCRNIV
jgi:hypothetical protein